MQCKCAKKNAYNAGKDATSQDLIYQHMSSHYRRILNAKKIVDTSPPNCYRKQQKRPGSGYLVPKLSTGKNFGRNISPAATERSISTNSYKESQIGTGPYSSSRYHAGCLEDIPNAGMSNKKKHAFNKNLVDRITYDTKNGPSVYCQDDWPEVKCEEDERKLFKSPSQVKRNNDAFKYNASPPRNTKRRLQSRENESREQKRMHSHIQLKNKISSDSPVECSSENPNCKCRKICICDSNDAGLFARKSSNLGKEQTSSRDSAYNGGISSLPESRSQTPENQKSKKDFYSIDGEERFLCRKKLNDSFHSKENLKSTCDSESFPSSSRYETPRKEAVASCSCATAANSRNQDGEEMKQMKEDALYIKFIQDITVEILEKCLYTNKSLIKVMKKHIINNLNTLDKDRMLKEVDHLRIQLGIPEDKTLFDLDSSTTISFGDLLLHTYPVISDSEFVDIPEEDPRKGKDATSKMTDDRVVECSSENSSMLSSSAFSKCETTENPDEKTTGFESSEKDEDDIIDSIHRNKLISKKVRDKLKRECDSRNSPPLAPPSIEIQRISTDDSDDSCDGKKDGRSRKKSQHVIGSPCFQTETMDKSLDRFVEEMKRREMDDKLMSERLQNDDVSVISTVQKKSRTVSFWSNKDVRIHQEKILETKMTSEQKKNNSNEDDVDKK